MGEPASGFAERSEAAWRFGPLVEATFVRRYHRFLADALLADGRQVTAWCANPGRMSTCVEEGGRILLSHHPDAARKLPYTWEMSRIGDLWVLANATLANRVLAGALAAGGVPELGGYERVQPEIRVAHGRLDFLLSRGDERCYVEVKNATLVRDRVASFPDAVSLRAARHMQAMARLRRAGHRAVVLFVVSRGDADVFRPAADVDPEFARALKRAVRAGVEPVAYRARVTPELYALDCALPVEL
jgi:sugar fermentation stimulation protein A